MSASLSVDVVDVVVTETVAIAREVTADVRPAARARKVLHPENSRLNCKLAQSPNSLVVSLPRNSIYERSSPLGRSIKLLKNKKLTYS